MKEGKGRDGWRISSQITWDIICLNELGWLSICVVIVRMEEDSGRREARVGKGNLFNNERKGLSFMIFIVQTQPQSQTG